MNELIDMHISAFRRTYKHVVSETCFLDIYKAHHNEKSAKDSDLLKFIG